MMEATIENFVPLFEALSVPVALDNSQFNKPEKWLRLTVAQQPSTPDTLGCDRNNGILFVDCFAPENEGPAPAGRLADEVKLAFPLGKYVEAAGYRAIVKREPYCGTGIQKNGFYMLPLTIQIEVMEW